METISQFEMASERLRFRRLRADDFALVAPLLQDEQTMQAWGHGWSYDEVCDWIADTLRRYREDGCGCLAALDAQTGALIALAGPLGGQPDDPATLGLFYLVGHDHRRQGYGTECARASLRDAFTVHGATRVAAVIRLDDIPALGVAAKCGMRVVEQLVLPYRGKEVPHVRCAIDKAQWAAAQHA
ncbi:MAG: GNAT family N-acetyltransferase [Eubacteriales bacterium]|nr:GNAT family N-acetyltransferase [Eubacteriales bacterium]